MMYVITVLIITATLSSACHVSQPGSYAKKYGKVWRSTTPTPAPSSTTNPTTTTETPTTYPGKGKRTRGLPIKGETPRELHDRCAKRPRLDQQPQAGTSQSHDTGIQLQYPCRGHDCRGCNNAGERCAAITSPEEDEAAWNAMWEDNDHVVIDDDAEEEPLLPPGQLRWSDEICESILRAGCCNACPEGVCNCGLGDHCEDFIRGRFERFRAYFTLYRKKWTKKPAPVVLYGPYKKSGKDVTTPPPPGGSSALGQEGSSNTSKCRFGIHLVGLRKRSSDCPDPNPGDAAEAVATAALTARCHYKEPKGKLPWFCTLLNLNAVDRFRVNGYINATYARFEAQEE